MEQPRRATTSTRRTPEPTRPAGRDSVHQGPDPARRCCISDGCQPDGPRCGGLLDGRLRRVALLARASRSLRCGDRAQPRRVRPDSAERLQHARIRGLRPGEEPVRRLDLQEAELPGTPSVFKATGLSLPMFIAVGDDEFKNPLPKDYVHDLDFEAHVLFNQAAAGRESDDGAPRRRRRPRLGRLGPGVRRGGEVHLQVPQPGAGDRDEGHADRHGPGGAGRRRCHGRGGKRLPGDRGRRIGRGPAVRGRQGPRPRQGLADRHAALDA